MNIITSLIRSYPEKAEGAVEDLADLFRASLQDVKNHIKLEDELELCKGYLRIEKHRLGNRLNVEWDLHQVDFNRDIPPLSLQPLVENAVYHGIELIPEGGTIEISARMNGKTIEISIRNPLVDKDNLRSQSKGHKLAQDNIKQRLEAIYHHTDLLVINEHESIYEIKVRIPEKNEDPYR
jgi:two-component system sensor histidine kinase AlgZ